MTKGPIINEKPIVKPYSDNLTTKDKPTDKT